VHSQDLFWKEVAFLVLKRSSVNIKEMEIGKPFLLMEATRRRILFTKEPQF